MKFEIVLLGITAFLVANVYHDGKYLKMVVSWKKYYQMINIFSKAIFLCYIKIKIMKIIKTN